jgi:hypothetical protein
MPGEDGPGQVIETSRTRSTVIALSLGLSLVLAVLDDELGVAMRAGDAIGPTEIADGLETLGLINEGGQMNHGTCLG